MRRVEEIMEQEQAEGLSKDETRMRDSVESCLGVLDRMRPFLAAGRPKMDLRGIFT